MALSYKAIIARGGGRSTPPQLERLSEEGLMMGSEWDLPDMLSTIGAWIGAATGRGGPPIDSGVVQAARRYEMFTIQRLMQQGIRQLGATRGEGDFLFTLKPHRGAFRSNWNQESYRIEPRHPRILLEGCLNQMEDAGMNNLGPLYAFARCIATLGNLRDGGRINAQLEMSTRGVMGRVLGR
jgi:hypothetical protein